MTDPTRLLDDPNAPPALRRALRAETRRPTSDALRAGVWGSLASQIALSASAAAGTLAQGAAGAATTASAGASQFAWAGLVSSGLGKSFAIGMAVGTTIAVTPAALSTLEKTDEPAPAVARSVETPQHSRQLVAEAMLNEADKEHSEPLAKAAEPREATAATAATAVDPPLSLPYTRSHPATASAAASAKPATRSFASQAREEATRVALARSSLRDGDGSACLARLARLDREMPAGVLIQERQALRIEALVALGRRTEAQQAASQFLQRYPESPYAARVQSWTALPEE